MYTFIVTKAQSKNLNAVDVISVLSYITKAIDCCTTLKFITEFCKVYLVFMKLKDIRRDHFGFDYIIAGVNEECYKPRCKIRWQLN